MFKLYANTLRSPFSRNNNDSAFLERAGDPTSLTSNRRSRSFAIERKDALERLETSPKSSCVKVDLRTYTDGEIEYYPWLFGKTLKHDSNGLVRKVDLDRLIEVSSSGGSKESICAVQQSQEPMKIRKLEGVATGNSYWPVGVDTQFFDLSQEFIPADDIRNVCEMIEVYEKGLLKDTSFIDIQNGGGDSMRAVQSMNNYLSNNGYTGPVDPITNLVTPKVLFRGIAKDVLIGPYVSQYLVVPYKYNGIDIVQQYPVEDDVTDTINPTNYLDIQKGIVGGSPNFSGDSKYAYNGRVLGSIVHRDPLHWAYWNAAIISLQNSNIGLEYNGNDVTSAWTDQGPPDLLSSIGDIALGALRVAWNSKYNIGLKLRPEVMAHHIDKIIDGSFTGGPFDTVNGFLSDGQATLDAVLAKNTILGNANHLLLLQYPEGSPTHPAYPAGHAVVAGACCTVLKALLKTHDSNDDPLSWPDTPQHSLDGDSLINYTESDAGDLTITGEVNKLAANMSIGRNIAGVHYRADGDRGMELGENFAIRYLQAKLEYYISTYNGMITEFKLEKFNGEYIQITQDNITVLKSR